MDYCHVHKIESILYCSQKLVPPEWIKVNIITIYFQIEVRGSISFRAVLPGLYLSPASILAWLLLNYMIILSDT